MSTHTNNPGVYDDLCTHVRERSGAAMVAVMVVGGTLGNGFSVQAVHPKLLLGLPEMLETMAAQIRAQQGQQ